MNWIKRLEFVLPLAGAACILSFVAPSQAQPTPTQQPTRSSPFDPGGPFYYGGLTREQAEDANLGFQGRMRHFRYSDVRPTIYFAMFDVRHVRTSIVLGYRFLWYRDGVTYENWVMMRTGFSEGTESEPRWASSDTCPQIATVVEEFRQIPPMGLDFFGPGPRWPFPVQMGLIYEVSARGVMSPDTRSQSSHQVTFIANDGPLQEFYYNAARELRPCWATEMPARPEGYDIL